MCRFARRLAIGAIAATLSLGASAGTRGEPEHLLLVTGIGGEAAYSQMFHDIAMTALDAAEHRLGLRAESVTYLAEDPKRDPRVDGRSTLADIERTVAALVTSGDGEGSLEPVALPSEAPSQVPALDGAYSARVYMDLSASARDGVDTPKGLSALRTRKAALRARIDSLVQRKAMLSPELYDERLERLLVDLTLNRRAMQQAEQQQ